jgi:hypothetical protein
MSDNNRIAALERDNVALKREVAALMRRTMLLESFVDVRHREKNGLTTDAVRSAWHGKPDVPESGSV